MKSLLTIKEVSDILQVNERTILRLLKAQKIPAVKIGNQWRFHPSRLEAWFLNGGEETLNILPEKENRWINEEDFQVFSKSRILLDLDTQSVTETFQEMVEVLAKNGHLLQKEIFLDALLDRERNSTTGIGGGVALPHAWHPINDLFRVPLVVCARLVNPIDFHAIDGKPVDLVFMLCAPRSRMHLELLSTMSEIGRNEEIIYDLRTAKTKEDFLSIVTCTAALTVQES